jgi:hypothetical protein
LNYGEVISSDLAIALSEATGSLLTR